MSGGAHDSLKLRPRRTEKLWQCDRPRLLGFNTRLHSTVVSQPEVHTIKHNFAKDVWCACLDGHFVGMTEVDGDVA